MKKKFFNKVLSEIMTVVMTVSIIGGSYPKTVLAKEGSEDYTSYATNEVVGDYNFGTDITETSLYSTIAGYGFNAVAYPNEAPGWANSVYNPRIKVVSDVAEYVSAVTGSAISKSLAISSKVWTETESSGYGVYTYENTSPFNVDLANADYEVSITLVNPTNTAYTAYLEVEDITKASGISVEAGATVSTTINTSLIDGQLNLKFLVASTVTMESVATVGTVYVSNVRIVRKATNAVASKPTIFIASDSTVQTFESTYYPQSGWGQALYNFFGDFVAESECSDCTYSQAQTYETSNVIIENRAIGGRSSKSFIEEGKLDDLLEDVKPGDYVMVQWGHNDATYSRPNRYVSAEDFPTYIQYYIDGCKQRGATCILVTPVARYSYDADGNFGSNFEAYRQAMITLGEAQDVPVLDLTGASIALCNEFGVEGSKSLFLQLAAGEYEGYYSGGVSDATHLQYYGAYKFAQCLAKLISDSTDSQLSTLKTYVDLNEPTAVPEAVTNLTTTTVGSTSISLSWDNVTNAELYYIYRAELGTDQTVDSIDFSDAVKYSVSSKAKYTDSNCDAGKTYVYAVRAFNSLGLGVISDKLSVVTKTSLYKYDFCAASTDPTMEGWIQVTSTQSYTEEAGYGWITAPNNGRYRVGNGNAASSAMADDFCLGNGEFVVDLPNGKYEVTIYAGDLLVGTSTIKASYTAEGASIGGISARQGIGSLTASVSVTDGQLNVLVGGTNAYINGMEITPLLLAPSSLSYSELQFSATQATFLIDFTGVDGAVSYHVYEKSSTDTDFCICKSILADDIDSLDARAMAANVGETREYYVTALMADGTETVGSSIISIEMVDSNVAPPEAPVNLSCVTAEEANIAIQWDAVEGAVFYNVYRSAKAENAKGYTSFVKVGETTTASYLDKDSDLDTNIHNYYKVEAVGIGGIGDLSAVLVTPVTDSLVKKQAENLNDRALVAVDLAGSKGAETNVTTKDANRNELTEGVFLSWRLFENDPSDVTFTVYRNDTVIASGLTVTNCVDENGSAGDVYKVVGSSDTGLGLESVATDTWDNYYIEMQLIQPENQTMPDGTIATYSSNDMSVGDLDNDGNYELIVKWAPSNGTDNSFSGYTGTTILDAYDIDTATGAANLLWRIDLGVNIRSGAHYTQFQVWDFDGDGSAEIMCKTADGSTTYQNVGGTLTETGYVGACDAASLPTNAISATNDYRNAGGYILEGPEYLTIFDGDTGRILDTTDYIPARGTVSTWGDGYGNRVDRFLSSVAYLDGENPSAVFCRGYYARTSLTAYDFVDTNNDGEGDDLQVRWEFDSNNYFAAEKAGIEAQGNHGISVNDIDGDGKDEIIYGALVIDHNGTIKYTTALGHGDAMRVSDWVPSNPGLEIFSVHEHGDAAYQVEVHDAETGGVLWGYYTGVDTGRGAAADIDPNYEGSELWANTAWNGTNGGLYSSLSTLTNSVKISDNTPSVNFTLFWDGDLLGELQDHTFDTAVYAPVSANITNWDYENNVSETLFESTEVLTNNGTKGNLGLVADVLGDWREEIIARCSADRSKIRIYTTTIQTQYVIPCLIQNSAYRIGVAWQNVAYNQPTNLEYSLSEGLVTSRLIVENITANSVDISFTEASDGVYGHDVEGYQIYRKLEGGTYELIATLDPNSIVKDSAHAGSYTYTDATATSGQTYYYKAAAVVDGKTSYMSEAVKAETTVSVKSVCDFELSIVEDTPIQDGGSVQSLLPAQLDVIDSNDNKIKADVTWDVFDVDITVPGEYTVIALIAGYDSPISKTLTVVVNTISGYNFTGYTKTSETEPYYTYNTVQNATALELPTTVTFSFANGTTEEISVTWDTAAVDLSQKATYITEGTTGALITSDGKFLTQKVKLNVIVGDDYITGFTAIDGVEVLLGSTAQDLVAALPSQVTATYKSGKQSLVPVTWDTNISSDLLATVGNFPITGTVENYSGNATITVYVNYNPIWKFDFGTSSSEVASGWTGVTVNPKNFSLTNDQLGITYSAAKGYGFLNGEGIIVGRSEGNITQTGILPTLVSKDYVIPDGTTFLVDVPNGTYNVEFVAGSCFYKSSVKVTIEDSGSVSVVGSGAGSYAIGYQNNVVVTDGQISFYFPTGNISRMDAIVIRQVSVEARKAVAQINGVSVTGWEKITSAITNIDEANQENSIIPIQMGDDTVLPEGTILALKGKNITVELQFEGYSWFVKGQDITGENVTNLNLEVTKNIGVIPNEIISSVAGENDYVSIQIAHDGVFGLSATLTINLNQTNNGLIANLFYYDETNGTLCLQSAARIDDNGNVNLRFNQASPYAIILSDKVLIKEEELSKTTVAPSAETLYCKGTTGKNATMDIEFPDVVQEAIEKGLAVANIAYASDNSKIVSVSQNGGLTARKVGKAMITTSVTIGDVTKTFTNMITVKKVQKGYKFISEVFLSFSQPRSKR